MAQEFDDKGDLPTPRTDEAKVYYSEIVSGHAVGLYWVPVGVSADLERELAEARMPPTRVSIPTETMEQEFQRHYQRGYEAGRKSVSATQRIPEGWALVPAALTAENGMKFEMSGEFSVRVPDGDVEYMIPWSTIKDMHRRVVEASRKLLVTEGIIAKLSNPASFKEPSLTDPIGYAVQMQDGPFVGIWRNREDAEHIRSKQPAGHNDRVVPVYAAPQALQPAGRGVDGAARESGSREVATTPAGAAPTVTSSVRDCDASKLLAVISATWNELKAGRITKREQMFAVGQAVTDYCLELDRTSTSATKPSTDDR